jgi:hypothetical protein
MTAPHRTWTVLPHGKLTEVEAGILTVVGTVPMPLGEFPRRMTIVRLRDGGLVVWSAIALDEDEMRALERYGRPAFLVVPNDHHRLDAGIWKQRYPAIVVATPAGARDKVARTLPVDTTSPDFGDPDVLWFVVPGTREHEAALLVHTPDGATLVLNDIVGNIRHPSGFGGWLMRLMGFAGDAPQVPAVEKLAMVRDSEALRTQLLEWAEVPALRRILVAHGDPIETDPRGALRELAASLS